MWGGCGARPGKRKATPPLREATVSMLQSLGSQGWGLNPKDPVTVSSQSPCLGLPGAGMAAGDHHSGLLGPWSLSRWTVCDL